MSENNIKSDTQVLYDWLSICDSPEPADLIFLFGGAVLDIPEKGLELFKKGLSPLISTNGNTGTFGNSNWAEPMAKIFADFLSERGVDRTNILVQDKSMNTLEDVTFSIPSILDKIPNIKSVILVSLPVHQRRAYATFIKQFPKSIKVINQPCFQLPPNELSGESFQSVKDRCIKEFDRIQEYSKKGDIESQDILEAVQGAVNRLKTI